MPNSLIFCPIFYQENVIGVITVQSFKKNAYLERALNIIKTLSAYCGIAYSNAQRFDNLEEKLKKKN
jgi:GAF domain-containing protein